MKETGSVARTGGKEEEKVEVAAEKKTQLKKYLKTKTPVYQTLAQQAGFRIKLVDGGGTCFDHEQAMVRLDVEQLERIGVDEETVDFLVQHELGHYQELYSDPDGYESVVKRCIDDPEKGKKIFRLYNSLMDVFVNTNSRNRNVAFRSKDGRDFSQGVHDLYERTLFERDEVAVGVRQQTLPLAEQFSAYLLNAGMGVGESLLPILDPLIQDIAQRKTKILGKEYTWSELIQMKLLPNLRDKTSVNDVQKKRSDSISQRKYVIDKFILPTYLQLLEEDARRSQSQQGEGENGEGQESKQQELDKETEKILKEWQDVLEKAKEKQRQDRMTPQEKQKQREKGQLQQEAKQKGLSEEELADFWERLQKMKPVATELVKVWQRITTESVTEIRKRTGFYKTGKNLSVSEAIRKFAKLKQDPSEVKVMERDTIAYEVKRLPRQFKLTLVVDLSGSMIDTIKIVQDMTIALADSLSSFNQQQTIRQFQEGEETVVAALEVWGFNTGAVPILTDDKKEVTVADIMGAYKLLVADGGTDDVPVLEQIKEKIDQGEKQHKIAAGEEVEIMIEITDGEVTRREESQALVTELKEKGMAVGGIYIGEQASGSFKEIFGEELGRTVAEAKNLPLAMIEILKEFLRESEINEE